MNFKFIISVFIKCIQTHYFINVKQQWIEQIKTLFGKKALKKGFYYSSKLSMKSKSIKQNKYKRNKLIQMSIIVWHHIKY